MRPSATTFCLKPWWRCSRSSNTSPIVLPCAFADRSPPISFAKLAVTLTSIAIGPSLSAVMSAGKRRTAKTFVVDQLRYRGVVSAERTLRIPPQLHDAEVHRERIEQQQPADERLADPKHLLDPLDRLDRAHDSRQSPKHARLRAVRHEAGRWRRREEAAIAAVPGYEDHRLTVEQQNAAVHERLAREVACVVHEVARREVVGPVHNHVVLRQDLHRVV